MEGGGGKSGRARSPLGWILPAMAGGIVLVFILAVVFQDELPRTLREKLRRLPVVGRLFLRSSPPYGNATPISSLHTISTSEQCYKTVEGSNLYGTLAQMSAAAPPFVDAVLGGGTKSGYYFDLRVSPHGQTFTCRSAPAVPGISGTHFFWTDTSGIIRYALDPAVDSNSPPLD